MYTFYRNIIFSNLELYYKTNMIKYIFFIFIRNEFNIDHYNLFIDFAINLADHKILMLNLLKYFIIRV